MPKAEELAAVLRVIPQSMQDRMVKLSVGDITIELGRIIMPPAANDDDERDRVVDLTPEVQDLMEKQYAAAAGFVPGME